MKDEVKHPYGQEPLHLVRWRVSFRSDPKDFAFEIGHASCSFAFEELRIMSNSNFLFPFRMRLPHGTIALTQKQLDEVIADWQHLMHRDAEVKV